VEGGGGGTLLIFAIHTIAVVCEIVTSNRIHNLLLPITVNKVDVLHVRLTELHAAHQNLPAAIRTLRLKETIQNIRPKMNVRFAVYQFWPTVN